jgi:Ca-activated chloride channel family protein
MENQDKLYNQFKDAAGKAEGKGFDRMDAVWNRVEEKLDSKKEWKPFAWFKYAGIAALLLLFAAIGTFIFKDSNTVTTPHPLPQNNVVTIDTSKVERTVGPSAEKPKEEVVVNEKTEKISVKMTLVTETVSGFHQIKNMHV